MKISALTAATTPLSGAELFPIVQSGNTRRVSLNDLLRSIGNGTAAAPALAPGGDPNTGIYFPAADTIGFVEGGVEVMRIDANGRVGIGTTSPIVPLHVAGQVHIQPSTANNALITFRHGSLATSNYIEGRANSSTVFGTANADRMTLDAVGNLGLGVTPSAWGSNYKALTIASGNAAVSSRTDAYRLFASTNAYHDGTNWRYVASTFASLYAQDSSQHQWFTAPSGTAGNAITFTQAMTLDASGNLGIGTTSALTRLHVRGTGGSSGVRLTLSNGGEIAALNDPLGVIDFYSDDVSVGASGVKGYLGVYNQFNGNWDGTLLRHATYMAFATSFDSVATERMRLDSAGNLGLGVTPSAWSGVGAVFQHPSVSISASAGGGTDTTAFTTNAIYNGTNWLYRTTAAATRYDQWAGSHRWFAAPSGTAGATVAFTMSWQINASGHLLAGTDNLHDIGASGATRPRDVFVARNVVASGQGNFGNLVIGTVSASLSNVSTGMVGYADSHPTLGNGTLVLQARSSVARPIVFVTGATTGATRMSVKEDGQVRFVPLASAPTTNVEDGDVYYDSGTNKLRVRAGGAWTDLH